MALRRAADTHWLCADLKNLRGSSDGLQRSYCDLLAETPELCVLTRQNRDVIQYPLRSKVTVTSSCPIVKSGGTLKSL